MSERKVNLEQSLIVQEQELLNPPSDGPVPEVALYRALRMAELAILGELERLNSSHKIVGLQLEYKAVEIPDTVTEEESQRLHEEAKLYSVAIGKTLVNSANSENISDSLETDFRDSLVERLYEYLNQQVLAVITPKKIYLDLLINFNSFQPSVKEFDTLRSRLESVPNPRTTRSIKLSASCNANCGKVCNDNKPHLRINGICKCNKTCND
ncbi:MAG: hypothetical protein ACK57R_04290 [Dolichospermum sp.]|nr:hypothetical protein [Anabaena sp. 49628_E55]